MARCQLCGIRAQLTDDHLPPKSLYPKTIRATLTDMHTVKACARCNNDATGYDEFFKIFVGLVADSPWPDELQKSVQSTLNKNNRLMRVIEENSRYDELEQPDGSRLTAKVVKIPAKNRDQFFSVAERLIKGLFFRKYREILVDRYQLSVFFPDSLHPQKLAAIQLASRSANWESVNNETIRYMFWALGNGHIIAVVNLFGTVELNYVIQEREDLLDSSVQQR